MGIFGYNTIGSSLGGSFGGYSRLWVCKFTASEKGTISKVTAYILGGWYKGSYMKAVIYADSSDAPAGLLASSSQQLIPYNDGAFAWYDFALSLSITNGTTYWIGFICDEGTPGESGGGYYKYDAGSSNQVAWAMTTDCTPPDPFGTPSGYFDQELSIYATYVAGGAVLQRLKVGVGL